jgi:hypothetical protein
MVGNKVNALVIGVIVGFLGFLFGCVTLCVGFILVVPYTAIIMATIYLLATGQPIFDPIARKSL